MKWPVLLMGAGLCFAAPAPKTFIGVVHDNHCVGPACATQCPVKKEPVYTLQSGEDAYVLTGPKEPAQYVGRKVIVKGTVVAGNRLKVASIAPAK